MDIFAETWPSHAIHSFQSKRFAKRQMKNAALFALGLLAAGVLFHDGARCQTSLAPPLSLAPPPPLSGQGTAPPAAAPTNSVWPPMAAPSVSPPRVAGKHPTSSAKSNVGSSPAMDDVPPPAETAKGSVPARAAKDVPPLASAPPSATVKDTPSAPDDVSPAPAIGRLPPLAKPATDYDGFSVGTVDDNDASSRTTRPVRSRAAKQSKRGQEADRVSGQQSVDPREDDKLKGKLTICRGCK
ncbi:hypothetical protein [Bradyrhizobium embrapense]|uniref:hypothetical protein n=1 Tax=Bradyrhizobium embrapense TaxID=630921 RepID=UPI000A79B5A6|nr:hypothetical protein [Bradyrhizobium embrapense]